MISAPFQSPPPVRRSTKSQSRRRLADWSAWQAAASDPASPVPIRWRTHRHVATWRGNKFRNRARLHNIAQDRTTFLFDCALRIAYWRKWFVSNCASKC